MSSTRSGGIEIPCESTMWPRNLFEDRPITHLSLFRRRPAFCHPLEETSQISNVVLRIAAAHYHTVHVHKVCQRPIAEQMMYIPMKALCCILQPVRHAEKLVEAQSGDDCCLFL